MQKSSLKQSHFRTSSLRATGSELTLLLEMAREAEDLAAQAKRIRELRRMARVSQEKAAAKVGVSVRAYADWEAGRSDIKTENLKALARYFGTTPDFIEFGVMKRQRGATPDPLAPSVDQRLTLIEEELRRLTGAVSELVAGMAELSTQAAERSHGSRTTAGRR